MLECLDMTTIEDLEQRVEALEIDTPTRRGIVAHIHELDQKFQRLDEGQQRLEHGQRVLTQRMDRLETKVDEGFERIEQNFASIFAYFKINYEP